MTLLTENKFNMIVLLVTTFLYIGSVGGVGFIVKFTPRFWKDLNVDPGFF